MATIPTYMTKRGTLTAGHGIIKTGIAASEIPFGAMVSRAADGTIQATLMPGTPTYDYLGIAVNDNRQQLPYDGFYAAGQRVPYVATGTAYGWLVGGQTIDTGNFVRLQFAAAGLGAGTEPLGMLVPETTPTTKTLYSVGRVVDAADSGSANYDQTITSYTGDVVTFASSTVKDYLELRDGDMVVIDSNEHGEVNMVADADYSSTAVQMVKNPLAGHTTSPTMYKLTQIEVALL